MEIAGYFMALIIGVSLGLIGGGGSILAVPVFAYMFYLDEKISTAYSLFVVGFASLVGGLRQHKNNNVDWRTAIVFGFPAIISVFIIRYFVVPALPDVFFYIDDYEFTRRMAMFGLFAILMLWASISMLFSNRSKGGSGNIKYNYPLILIEGLVVGAITGFVGAGGGFLIIPALVLLANLEIKKAIGTSLVIIALKSILGFFLGDALTMTINWQFLFVFTAIAIAGIFLGVFIGNFVNGKKLKKAFAYFIFVMAIFVFVMEFIVKA